MTAKFEIDNNFVAPTKTARAESELTRKMTAMTGFTSTAYVGETRILTLNEDKNQN